MYFISTYHYKSFLSLIIILFSSYCYAQFDVSDTISQNEAKVAEYLTGKGVVILNPKTTCENRGLGTYIADPSVLTIEEGVVLTTGLIMKLEDHANNQTSASSVGNGLSDPDLDSILQTTLSTDVCILEFDLIPTGDTLSFNYIFASEEYPKFNCAEFNDAFGFFISNHNDSLGPYSNNSRNIALIPTTNTPVSINTVNSGIIDSTNEDADSSYCINIDSFWKDYTNYYIDNSSNKHLAFNGMTVPLQAIVQVTPCDTYHLKMAIGDGGDNGFDSGVFLEKGSISSNKMNLESLGSSQIFEELVEGCFPVSLYFERKLKARYTEEILYYTIKGSASRGVDYFGLPDSVLLRPGQDDTTLIITALEDNLNEPTETIIIKIKNDALCGADNLDSIIINIVDSNQLEYPFPMNDDRICDNSSVEYQVTPLTDSIINVLWFGDQGIICDTCLNTSFTPDSTTKYQLQITSPLNCIFKDSFTLKVFYSHPLQLRPDTVMCVGEQLNALHNLADSDTIYFKNNWQVFDENQSVIPMTNDNLFNPYFTITQAYNKITLVIEKDGCPSTDSFIVRAIHPPNLDPTLTDSVCQSSFTTLSIPNCGDSCFWFPETYLYALDTSTYLPNNSLLIRAKDNIQYTIIGRNRDTINNFPITCVDTTLYSVKVEKLPAFIWRNKMLLDTCMGDTFRIEAIERPSETYQWSYHPSIISTRNQGKLTFVLEEESDTIELIFTATDTLSKMQCSLSDTIKAKFQAYPELYIEEEMRATIGQSYQIEWNGNADNYSWSPSNLIAERISEFTLLTTNLSLENNAQVLDFNVQAINNFGHYQCITYDTLKLHLFEQPYTVPTVFSPNGDGINDLLQIIGLELDDFHIKIYNRWGNLVYELNNWGEVWDGRNLNGNQSPSGIYVWVSEGSINGLPIKDPKLKMGEITLIR